MSIFSKLLKIKSSEEDLFDEWMKFFNENEFWINNAILFKEDRCPFKRKDLLEMLAKQADKAKKNGLWDRFKDSYCVHLALILKFRMKDEDYPLVANRLEVLNAEMELSKDKIEFLKENRLEDLEISETEKRSISQLLEEAKDFCTKTQISFEHFALINAGLFAFYKDISGLASTLNESNFKEHLANISWDSSAPVAPPALVKVLAKLVTGYGVPLPLKNHTSLSEIFYTGVALFINRLFKRYKARIYEKKDIHTLVRRVAFVTYAVHETITTALDVAKCKDLELPSSEDYTTHLLTDTLRALNGFEGNHLNDIRKAITDFEILAKNEDFRKETLVFLLMGIRHFCTADEESIQADLDEKLFNNYVTLAVDSLLSYADKP